jgi:hypothetical protein
MADAADLITLAYAHDALRAGGVVLDAGQASQVPGLITAASKTIAREIDREFVSQTYDEILLPLPSDAAAGERPLLRLTGAPVLSVASLRVDRRAVLTIRNTDATTNQRASVALTYTGDPDKPWSLVATGVTLSRTASGVASAASVTFADNPTVAALADAINALGNGWTASAASGYTLHPSADLTGAYGARGAFGGVHLDLFATDVEDYTLDHQGGTIELGLSCVGTWGYDWPRRYNEVRAVYTAGYATIPEPIQQACAELVKAGLDRLTNDGTVQSESTKDYSYTMWAEVKSLPRSVLDMIESWRRWTL